MTESYRWRTLAVVMVGYALVMMGITPVNLIMPSLSQSLGVPLHVASWLLTGNLLAMTAFILPAGRLGDRYGHKVIFLWGLAIYTLTSGLGGLVNSYGPLLLVRLAQGVSSAFINGTAMAWVTNVFPATHRGRVVGAVTLASFVGGIASSFMGPWALQNASWHLLFWMLVPPGALALAAGLGIPDAPPTGAVRRRPLDWAGVIVLGAALIVFSLSLNHLHGGAESWADGWRWHLPMHVLAGSLLILFVVIERQAAEPIMPLHYLRNRTFLAALGANMMLHLAMMGSSAVLPFLLQNGMGLTPRHTGNLSMLLQVLAFTMAPLSGWLYDKADSRMLLPGSMVILASAFFLFGLYTTWIGFTSLLWLAVYMGIGMGLFLSANNAALMSAAPREARGFASGMMETTRQLGHGVATTMVGTILSYGFGLVGTDAARDALQTGFRTTYWLLASLAMLGFLFSLWHALEHRRAAGQPASAGAAD